jgi:hypothetical protein
MIEDGFFEQHELVYNQPDHPYYGEYYQVNEEIIFLRKGELSVITKDEYVRRVLSCSPVTPSKLYLPNPITMSMFCEILNSRRASK